MCIQQFLLVIINTYRAVYQLLYKTYTVIHTVKPDHITSSTGRQWFIVRNFVNIFQNYIDKIFKYMISYRCIKPITLYRLLSSLDRVCVNWFCNLVGGSSNPFYRHKTHPRGRWSMSEKSTLMFWIRTRSGNSKEYTDYLYSYINDDVR